MKLKLANCPACGGLVEFRLGTALVTICGYCHSVLARAGKNLEDHGKVADLVETDSAISLGQVGRFGKNGKKPFEVVGRVQYQHPAGGVWNEWYLKFPGDQVRWLAEAQGKLWLMEEVPATGRTTIPSFEDLTVGESLQLPGGKSFLVAEKAVALAVSAVGDIPWAFRAHEEHRFADLHSEEKGVATIEYQPDGPVVFLGRGVSLSQLGLSPASDQAGAVPVVPNASALQLNCPHCAGPLALVAPDKTQRVCCPNCRALLDCQQGALKYLKTLEGRTNDKPLIPLGSVGKLGGVDYTVIGFMRRSVTEAGTVYPWTEYLLHSPSAGFRWLICNKNHWSIAESVTSGRAPANNLATFEGTEYRLYDRGTATVNYVVGEFNWKVEQGEKTATEDYIAPPYMLSFERTCSSGSEELNVTRATYLDIETLETAFGLKELPRPWDIGVIQPNPGQPEVWAIWACSMAVLFVLFLIVPEGQPNSGRGFHFFMAMIGLTAWPLMGVFLRHTREVSRWSNSDYSPYAQESDS